MKLKIPTVRALAWLWGSVAVAGGAGAAVVQIMGPPSQPMAATTSTTDTAPAPAAMMPAVGAPSMSSSSSPFPRAKRAMSTASALSNPRAAAQLPALRKSSSGKPHKVELAAARKPESHATRRSTPVTTVAERPRSQAQWAEQQTPYWSYPATQYAVARMPRYAYPASPYYGYYGGY
jgi:hypothetical protein